MAGSHYWGWRTAQCAQHPALEMITEVKMPEECTVNCERREKERETESEYVVDSQEVLALV